MNAVEKIDSLKNNAFFLYQNIKDETKRLEIPLTEISNLYEESRTLVFMTPKSLKKIDSIAQQLPSNQEKNGLCTKEK